MTSKFLRVLFGVCLTGVLWGCYPGGAEYYSDYDIVYTNYDKAATFTGHPNYYLPDKIIKITGNSISGEAPEFISPTYATMMLESMKKNMNAMGYTQVSNQSSADFVLVPAGIEVTNIGYYYDWWYGYWGWGWYYPYPITYSYSTGSLFMILIDNRNTAPNGKKPAVWTAICNGLLEGSSADFSARMNKSIDQAFTQSEYLHQ